MISLSDDGDADAARKFVTSRQITWPQGMMNDETGSAARSAYGVSGIPVTILIGTDGRILRTDLQEKDIRPAVEAALKAIAR